MTINPYDPPKANITNRKFRDTNYETGEVRFYTFTQNKFWILMIGTAGLYLFGWAYRNWQGIKKTNRSDIWPIPRTIFLIFCLHSMVKYISNYARRIKYNDLKKFQGKATPAVIVLVINFIIEKLAGKNIGYPIVDIISILLIFVIGFVFWEIQKHINIISGDPNGDKNKILSVGNILWIILGVILWALFVFNLIYGDKIN